MRYEIARMKMWLGRNEEAVLEIETLIEEHGEVHFIKEAALRFKNAKARGLEIREGLLPPSI